MLSSRRAPPVLRLLGVIVFLAAGACGQSALVWTGAVSADWNDAANWNPMQTPTGVDTASVAKVENVIGVAPFQPTISDATAVCLSLTTSGTTTGGILRMTPAAVLTLGGGAVLNGKITAVMGPGFGTLRFVGATAAALSSTSSRECSVEVDKPGGSLTGSNLSFEGSLTILDGSVSFTGDCDFSGSGIFSGGTFVGPTGVSSLFVIGDVAFSGTSVTTDLNLAAGSNLATDAAFAPPAGAVLLNGLGSGVNPRTLTGAGSFFDLDLSGAGPISLVGATVARNVSVTGTAVTLQAGATLSIGGNLVVTSGGSLISADPAAIFDIAGAAQLSGAVISGLLSADVGGNWTSTAGFAPTGGRVRFDGATQSVDNLGAFFDVVVASSGVATFDGETISGDLTVQSGTCRIAAGSTLNVSGDVVLSGGTLLSADAAALFDVAGDVQMDGGGPLALFNADVAGDWVASAVVANLAGLVTFDGAGPQVVSGPAAFADVVVATGGAISFGSCTIGDDLDVLSGACTAAAGATVAVAGDATFSGGSVASADAVATFDVGGTTLFNGASASGLLNIAAAGDWTSDASFAPTSGTTTFDGAAQIVSNAGSFFDVVVAASGVVSCGPTLISGDLAVTSGTCRAAALSTLAVGGDATIGGGAFESADATSLFDVAGDFHADGGGPLSLLFLDLAGDWIATTPVAYVAGRVRFDGTGPQAVSGPAQFADVLVGATGPVVFGSCSIGGDFDLLAGACVAGAGATVAVAGDATCLGGSLASIGPNAVFDVGGAVVLTGCSVAGEAHFEVGGAWTADAAFAPTSSLVRFDGAAPQAVSGAGVFRDVEGASSGGVTYLATSAIVNLSVTSGSFTAPGPATLDINGALVVAPGAVFSFGAGGATVAGDATLNGTVVAGGPLTFDGGSAAASGAAFPPFTVSKPGAALALSATTVLGAVVVDQGTLAAAGALIVVGSFTVQAAGAFAGGAFTHEFRAAFTADGPASGSGSFVFAPPAVGGAFPPLIPVRSASAFPDVTVAAAPGRTVSFVSGATASFGGSLTAASGGLALLGPASATGDVLVAGGTLMIHAPATFAQDFVQTAGASVLAATTVLAGDVAASGGTFTASALFDVAGSAVFNGTTATGAAELRVAGDWSSGPLFNPISGTVTLTGSARTVFGAPTFFGLNVAAGASLSTAAVVRVRGGAVLHGALTTFGTFVADAAFAVVAGGLFDAVAGTHRFGGSFSVASGGLVFLPGARLRFDGATSAQPVAADPLPDVEAAKSGAATLTLANLTIGGGLFLTSGTLATGASVTVQGSLNATGGTLSALDHAVPLMVQGGATFAGATAGALGLSVGGDFTSDALFAPTGGAVTLAAPGPHVIFGTGSFGAASLVLAGGVTTASASLDVQGAFRVEAGATFDASPATHVFGGDFTCLGALGPSGAYAFDGTSDAVLASVVPLPAMNAQKGGGATLVAGDASIASTTAAATLVVFSGKLVVGAGTTLAVSGGTVFVGGMFETSTGALLDVDGSLTFITGSATGAADIRVAGDFIAGNGGFQPASGALVFDGGGSSQITLNLGAAPFDLRVEFGTTLDVQSPGLLVAGATIVDGILQSGVTSSFRGPVQVSSSGSFDGGDQPHLFGDDVLVVGQMIHVLPLVSDGTAAAELGGVAPLPPIVIAKTGTGSAELGGALPFVAPSLTQTSGFSFVPASSIATVNGPAVFTGGIFASQNLDAVLDVAGDVSFAGAVVQGLASLDCAGAWSADAGFAPTSGRVRFDGVPGTSAAPTVAGATLFFPELSVVAGTLTFANDAMIAADAIDVAAGATLRVAGATVRLGPTTLDVQGEVFVDVGGTLELDDQTALTVPVGATLRLTGDPAAPATIAGVGPAGFSARVEGGLAARNFRLVNPAAQGFVIDVTATPAPAPDDFRGGTLSGPRAGGALLDVRRSTPAATTVDFRYLTFEDPASAPGAFNVRAPFGTPVSFTNFGGAFGGEAFDDDPQGRATWNNSQQTTILGFLAQPGPSVVTVSWITGVEIDAASFIVEKRELPAPTFDFVAEVAAGALYQVSDFAVLPSTSYEYRLSVRLTHGAVLPLATQLAQTPLLLGAAPNIFGVGAGRSYATPQAAVDAALASGAASATVRLAPGMHPSFTISGAPPGALRIVADAGGPVILDASSAPVLIENLVPGRSVELRGLVVDAGGAAHPALELLHVASPVIVDACVLIGGAGPAARATSTIGFALQRSSLDGQPGLVLSGGAASTAGVVCTGVTASGGALLRNGGSDLGLATFDASSTSIVYAGPASLLDAPSIAALGGPCHVAMTGAPALPWILAVSLGHGYLPPLAPLEMPVLIDLSTAAILATGTTNAAGSSLLPLVVPPIPFLVGLSFRFQAASVDYVAGAVRISSVVAVTVDG
jgi:hypothetical protein